MPDSWGWYQIHLTLTTGKTLQHLTANETVVILEMVMGNIWIVIHSQITYRTPKACFPTLFRWVCCLWFSFPLPPCPITVPLSIPFSSSFTQPYLKFFYLSATSPYQALALPRWWLPGFCVVASRYALRSLVMCLLQFISMCSALCLTSFVPQKGWFLTDLRFSQSPAWLLNLNLVTSAPPSHSDPNRLQQYDTWMKGMEASSTANIRAPSQILQQAPQGMEMTLLQGGGVHTKSQRSCWGRALSTVQQTRGQTALSACLSFQDSWMPAKHWHFGELGNARDSIFARAGSRLQKNFSQEKRTLFRFATWLNIGLPSLH